MPEKESTDAAYDLELENSRQIHAIHDQLGELRANVAAIPGKVTSSVLAQLETHHPSNAASREIKWAMGVMITVAVGLGSLGLTIVGAVAWNMQEATSSIHEVLRLHTQDGHPYTVQAEVRALSASLEGDRVLYKAQIDHLAEELKVLERDQQEFDMQSQYGRGRHDAEIENIKYLIRTAHGIMHRNTDIHKALTEKDIE